MHIKGTQTVARAVSIALRMTSNLTIATNNPVPIVWGARDGVPDTKRFTHSVGNYTITIAKSGKYKFSVRLNGRMTGSSASTQNRTDNVVAFLAINNISLTRSILYAAPYQQSGGYFTIAGDVEEVDLVAGDFVALYVYRLATTGTIVLTSTEATMAITQTSAV